MNKHVFESWWKNANGEEYIEASSTSFRNNEAYELYRVLESYLACRKIRAYHATRLIDKNEVLENGLVPLKTEQHIERINNVLMKKGVPPKVRNSVSETIRKFSKETERDTGTISLFNSFSQYENRYYVFSEVYGGEVVSSSIERDFPEEFKILSEVGFPTLIYCLVDWSRMDNIYRVSCIQTIISAILSRYFLDNNDIEASELRISGKIETSSIEKIEDMTYVYQGKN